MTKRTLALPLALVAMSAGPAPAPAATFTKCAAKIDSTQFFKDMKVSGVTCLRGAEIARAWVRRYGAPAVRGGKRLPKGPRKIDGWSCRIEFLKGVDNPYGRVTCRRGRARIVFYG